jgi:hypothetical protein
MNNSQLNQITTLCVCREKINQFKRMLRDADVYLTTDYLDDVLNALEKIHDQIYAQAKTEFQQNSHGEEKQ